MSADPKEIITAWLRGGPPLRGSLVRGVRFADETFVSDVDLPEFPGPALEQVWRLVADTFQVLSAQRLPPSRLTWTHEKTVLHCARRNDGAIFGVFLSRKTADGDPVTLEKLLGEFQTLETA